MNIPRRVWLGATLSLVVACGDDDETRLPVVGTYPAHAVENGLLFLDDSGPQGYLLDVTQKTPKVKHVDLPQGQKSAFQRPGQKTDEVVLLTAGLAATRERGDKQPEVEAHVVVVGALGERARYPLGSRFGSLSLSEDGRYAVAYAPQAGFSFATSIAVVDLEKPPVAGANPRLINVTSLDGTAPTRFMFSPELDSAGERRRFLFTLGTNHINMLDLGHLERGDITIPLTLPNTGETLEPNDILFAGSEIYVQSRGADAVLVLQLTKVALNLNRHGFAVSLDTLPLGSSLLGIEFVGNGEARRLLAMTNDGARLINRDTGNGKDLEVAGGYENALTFEGRSPSDDAVGQRALLYGSGAKIAFVDLSQDADAVGGNTEEYQLSEGVTRALLLSKRNQLVLTHAGEQLSLVDLEERTVAPLSLGNSVAATYLDASEARLWITTTEGSLGTLDLASLSPSQILLDADARALVPIRGESAQIAVIHPSASGFVTLLQADKPSLDSAQALLGFFWGGVLK